MDSDFGFILSILLFVICIGILNIFDFYHYELLADDFCRDNYFNSSTDINYFFEFEGQIECDSYYIFSNLIVSSKCVLYDKWGLCIDSVDYMEVQK